MLIIDSWIDKAEVIDTELAQFSCLLIYFLTIYCESVLHQPWSTGIGKLEIFDKSTYLSESTVIQIILLWGILQSEEPSEFSWEYR